MPKVVAELQTVADTKGVDKANRALDSLTRKINGLPTKEMPSFTKMADSATKANKQLDNLVNKASKVSTVMNAGFNVNASGLNSALSAINSINGRLETMARRFERVQAASQGVTKAARAAATNVAVSPPAPPKIPKGGGGSGDGGGDKRKGMFGSLASKSRSLAYHSVADKIAVDAPRGIADAAGEASKERFIQSISGIDKRYLDVINSTSDDLASKYKTLNTTQYKGLGREAFYNVSDKSQVAPMMGVIARATQFNSLFTKNSEDNKREMERLIKSADLMGNLENTGDAEKFFNNMIAARQVLGRDFTNKDIVNMTRMSKSARYSIGDEFKYTVMPSLMDEMGGSRGGNALSSFMSSVAGFATKQVNKNRREVGLAGEDGKVVQSDLAVSNPARWIWGPFSDLLRKNGILDNNNKVVDEAGLNKQLVSNFGNKVVADFVSSILHKRQEYENKMDAFGKVKTSAADAERMNTENVSTAFGGIKRAGESLTSTVEPYTTKLLGPLFDTISTGMNYLSKNPDKLVTAGVVGAGVAGVYQTGKYLAENPLTGSAVALGGSAVALNGAAAALTAAATMQGVGGAVGGAAATGGIIAGAWAGAKWLGRGALRLAPWVGTGVAAYEGLNYFYNYNKDRSEKDPEYRKKYQSAMDGFGIAPNSTFGFGLGIVPTFEDAASKLKDGGTQAGESVRQGGQGAIDIMNGGAAAVGATIGRAAAAEISAATANINVNVNGSQSVGAGTLNTGGESPK